MSEQERQILRIVFKGEISVLAAGTPIEQPAGPTADFSVSGTGVSRDFTDASSAGDSAIAAWAWDFGDGTTSTAEDPSHTFPAQGGTFNVSLTVTDGNGLSDTKLVQIDIAAATGPTAGFSVSLNELEATFTDASSAGDSAISSYLWEFGDGNTSTLQNPVYAYATPGTRQVRLTVTDGNGLSDSYQMSVTVENTYTGPTADFSISGSGANRQFTNASTPGDAPIIGYSWEIQSGTPSDSTEQNPGASWSTPGTYEITLEVTDANGLTDTVSKTVTIAASAFASPDAQFGVTPNAGGSRSLNLTDKSVQGAVMIIGWAWDFGNGTTSTSQNPSVTYAADGTYPIQLEVTDDNGNTDTVSLNYTVPYTGPAPRAPIADFSASGSGLSRDFTDATEAKEGTLKTWAWDFGDGNTSSEQNPTHNWATDGTYSVSLTVTDANGLESTFIDSITVSV